MNVTIRAVHDNPPRAELVRNEFTTEPGIFGLYTPAGELIPVGEIIESESDTVTRALSDDAARTLQSHSTASWTGTRETTPKQIGLDWYESGVRTEVGAAPAWVIPGASSEVWALHVHGLGGLRRGTLRGVKTAYEAGLSSLVVSFRNDGEGPSHGRGRSTLGEEESADVADAIRHAATLGARSVVLFGWSMGAAIVLHLADTFKDGPQIIGVVAESPVLGWRDVLRAGCARLGLPRWCGDAALPWLRSGPLSRLVGMTSALRPRKFDWTDPNRRVRLPVLVLHGTSDKTCPISASRLFAAAHPQRVQLEEFRGAGHTTSWNSEPDRWEKTVAGWLDQTARSATDRSGSGFPESELRPEAFD